MAEKKKSISWLRVLMLVGLIVIGLPALLTFFGVLGLIVWLVLLIIVLMAD